MSRLNLDSEIFKRFKTASQSFKELFVHESDVREAEYKMRRFGYTVCLILILGGGLYRFANRWPLFLNIQVIIKVCSNNLRVNVAVLVKDGDFVEANTPLILLDSARDQADLNIVEMRKLNMMASVERLTLEEYETNFIF